MAPTIRALLNPYPPRFSEAMQRERISPAAKVYHDIEKFVTGTRAGDLNEVPFLFLLAPAHGQIEKRKAALKANIKGIIGKPRFGIIVETSTGRRSDGPDWHEAVMEAREALGNSARGIATGAKNGAKSEGRPNKLDTAMPDPALRERIKVEIRGEFNDARHADKTAATAAVNKVLAPFKVSVTRGWCYANLK